jgi:predicted kinase
MIELDCDDETLRARLRARSGGVSDAREEQLAAFRRDYQAATEVPADDRLILDTRLPVDELVRRVAVRLAAPASAVH